jgi:lactose/L-arabinose transport system substrate-binding protein
VAVDVDAKLPTTLATGVNVPDGSFYEDANLPVQAGHFYDLTDLMKPYVSKIVPFKVQVNTQNGRILGIPWDLDPGLLYYREDLLHKAGVDPTSITTYDELFTVAQTLQKKLGSSVKPLHIEQDPGLAQLWVEMFANQQGVSMVDAHGKLTLDSAPYLKIMQWLKRVNDAGLGTRAVYYSPTRPATSRRSRPDRSPSIPGPSGSRMGRSSSSRRPRACGDRCRCRPGPRAGRAAP